MPAEEAPEVSVVLPAGYTEQRIPDDLFEAMMGESRSHIWSRCFDTGLGWEGLKDHVLAAIGPDGFEDTTQQWLPYILDADFPSSIRNDVMQIYTRQNSNVAVMLVNLQVMKDYGAEIDSTGDYVAAAVYDNLEHYK